MSAAKENPKHGKAKRKPHSEEAVSEAHRNSHSQLQATINEYQALEIKKKLMDRLIIEKQAQVTAERQSRAAIEAENKVLRGRLSELREDVQFQKALAEERRIEIRSENAKRVTELERWKNQLYAVMAKHETTPRRTSESWEKKSLQKIVYLIDALVKQLDKQPLDGNLVRLLAKKLVVEIEHNRIKKQQAQATEPEMDEFSDVAEGIAGWSTSISNLDLSDALTTGEEKRTADTTDLEIKFQQSSIQAQMRAIYEDPRAQLPRPIKKPHTDTKSRSPRAQKMLKRMAPSGTKCGIEDDHSSVTLNGANKSAYRTFMKELLRK